MPIDARARSFPVTIPETSSRPSGAASIPTLMRSAAEAAQTMFPLVASIRHGDWRRHLAGDDRKRARSTESSCFGSLRPMRNPGTRRDDQPRRGFYEALASDGVGIDI